MSKFDHNSAVSTRGVIRLPEPSKLQYPIKITALHISPGNRFKAENTLLYTAMDATGKILEYRHDLTGEIITNNISAGDIFTQPENVFEVWLFEANKTGAATKKPATPAPEKKPSATSKTPKTNPRPKKHWSDTFFGGMFMYLAGCGLLLAAFVGFMLWEEGARDRAILVPLATDLFYYGNSYETRTDGVAVLSIPVPKTDDRPRSYQEIECPLTRSEYDLIADALKPVGEVEYAQWFIYRTRLFNTFECEFSSNQNWQYAQGRDAATTIGLLDIGFLFALKEYDSSE